MNEAGKVTARKLTAAMEDYIKEIFHLDERGDAITTAALASGLAVAPPSVTSMVKRLCELGLVVHSPYKDVELTPAGRLVALEIVRHHRLTELYLAEFLDIPWDKVHDEAEKLEHVISEEVETRMADKLGQPGFDPHGDPIPTFEGAMAAHPTSSLWDASVGDCVEIARVSDRDPGLLGFLREIGLVPGAIVHVLSVSTYGGTLVIRVAGREQVIGCDLARNVRTRRVPAGMRSRSGGSR
jgi:DtxR family transcriptional regulator, Mn-dependent transcriptional regulator